MGLVRVFGLIVLSSEVIGTYKLVQKRNGKEYLNGVTSIQTPVCWPLDLSLSPWVGASLQVEGLARLLQSAPLESFSLVGAWQSDAFVAGALDGLGAGEGLLRSLTISDR
jgi:hypothetical protein